MRSNHNRFIAPFTLALFSILVPHAPAQQPNAATPVSDWSYTVEPNATIKIFHKGLKIVDCAHIYWGKNWAWSGTELRAKPTLQDQYVISGTSSGVGLGFAGRFKPSDDGTLLIDLVIDAAHDMPDVIGGGMAWNLLLDSPTFTTKPPDPELLADSKGWKWSLGPSATITVQADEPLSSVFFERGQKSSIRSYFKAKEISAGQQLVHLSITLPEGARHVPSDDERYASLDTAKWYRNALLWNASPVNLSFLNRQDRPAGIHGFVKPKGDQLVFEDGTSARFWGANLAANALYNTPRQNVPLQAKRMAQLGYNLMRIHHHDSDWVSPNIFQNPKENTRVLNAKSLDALDWWIKCLHDEGIYVWLDMHVGRILAPGDGVTLGTEEIVKLKGRFDGLAYLNPQLQKLMERFQETYLKHVNIYTKKAYKDDPGVMGILVTNEDDITTHYGNSFLPDHHLAEHNRIWTEDYKDFASRHKLSESKVFQTWLPGPSKIHLNDVEHRFNEIMLADLKSLGVRVPIATTNTWGGCPLFSLPALSEGGVIDVHSYGEAESLSTNPRYQPNYIAWIGAAQVYDKPLTITEWNVEYPKRDRFTAPLYVAAIASLQGWDAPMLYNFSQLPLVAPGREDTWSTHFDPAITGMMPAAALAFRRGHISPARDTYCFMPGRELFDRQLAPDKSATIRTLVEQSKLTIGMPSMPELPWLQPSNPQGATVVTDPDHDFIPTGQSFVKSDTGELTRDWQTGIQTIDSDRTQSVSGWIGGQTLQTRDATFTIDTKKAVVALSSVDDLPIATSKFILISAMARVVSSTGGATPMLSEPILGHISIRSNAPALNLLALGADGRVISRSIPRRTAEAIEIDIPAPGGTHWFVLKAEDPSLMNQSTSNAPSATPSPR